MVIPQPTKTRASKPRKCGTRQTSRHSDCQRRMVAASMWSNPTESAKRLLSADIRWLMWVTLTLLSRDEATASIEGA